MKKTCEKIEKWISEKTGKANAKGCVFGMSGDPDSGVLAVLAKRALGRKALGLILPCDSDPKDREHALMVAKRFSVSVREVDLTNVYNMLSNVLPKGDGISRGNLKARLRMLVLYYFANTKRYLVLGTGNRSGLLLGHFTKYGDGGVDLLPLGGLYKTEVMKLAKYLSLPKEVIGREPSAGFHPERTDRGEPGLSYEKLDGVLRDIEGREMLYSGLGHLMKVKGMIRRTEHKRRIPEICRP
jgi:NAD+ synthase